MSFTTRPDDTVQRLKRSAHNCGSSNILRSTAGATNGSRRRCARKDTVRGKWSLAPSRSTTDPAATTKRCKTSRRSDTYARSMRLAVARTPPPHVQACWFNSVMSLITFCRASLAQPSPDCTASARCWYRTSSAAMMLKPPATKAMPSATLDACLINQIAKAQASAKQDRYTD